MHQEEEEGQGEAGGEGGQEGGNGDGQVAEGPREGHEEGKQGEGEEEEEEEATEAPGNQTETYLNSYGCQVTKNKISCRGLGMSELPVIHDQEASLLDMSGESPSYATVTTALFCQLFSASEVIAYALTLLKLKNLYFTLIAQKLFSDAVMIIVDWFSVLTISCLFG